ncbi:MAG TPA: hypothetical protein VFW96_07315, partial [Thermomicrobiales bacterium]|nr:hypothetical protein [Thermomicrobiales bacterium]
LLARLGGGAARATRPPGTLVLARGPRRRLDHLATAAIRAAESRRRGGLPPRLAALLGRAGPTCVPSGGQARRLTAPRPGAARITRPYLDTIT